MKTNNYFLHIILTMLLCCMGKNAYAYDIAVKMLIQNQLLIKATYTA